MSPIDRSKPPHAAPPDPDDPPSDDEIRAGAALRRALDESPSERGANRATAHDDAATRRDVELSAAIRAAAVPTSISAPKNRALLERALAGHVASPGAPGPAGAAGPAGESAAGERPRDGQVVSLASRRNRAVLAASGGVVGLLAMAAAIALVVRSEDPVREAPMAAAAETPARGSGAMAQKREDARPAFAMARSTAELFPEGIPRTGGTTARIDRIASARAQDFRQNQFARWRTR